MLFIHNKLLAPINIWQANLLGKSIYCSEFGNDECKRGWTGWFFPTKLWQRLHWTGSVWPGGSGTNRICYLVPNGSTYEGDPMWNRTVPV